MATHRPKAAGDHPESIAGAKLGHMPSYYKEPFGGWQARVLSEPGFPSFAFHGTRGRRVLPGRWTAGPHHHYLEQGLSDGSRDRPMLDGRGDEGGLRRRRATVVERHLTDGKKVFQWVVGDNLVFATRWGPQGLHAVALYEGNPNNTRGGSPQAYAGYVAAVETPCKIR